MNSSPDPSKTVEQAIKEQQAAEPVFTGWGGMVVGLTDPIDDIASVLTNDQQLEMFGCLANED